MVYYFTSTAVDPPAFIYVGKDKVENEDLIKFGWEEDVWFHVDNLSSAHVYLRLTAGESWTSIPQPLLEDCAQLTKANSIDGTSRCQTTLKRFNDLKACKRTCTDDFSGNKKDNVTIIYTPWTNLKKD